MTGKKMTSTRWIGRGALAAAACFIVMAAPAVAAPGGGGGGLPSTPSKPAIDPAQSYQEGVDALAAGDYKTAEKKFGEVLSVSRKMPEANYYMGIAKVNRGKDKSSVRYFERAIKYREGFVEAHEQLALVFIRLGKDEKAQKQLATLNAIKNGCTAEACEAAYAERTTKAIAAVEAALGGNAVADEDISAAPIGALHFAGLAPAGDAAGEDDYAIAVRLINQERFAEAIDALYLTQSNIGPHPDILNYLGFAHRKAGAFDAAKEYYAQALDLNPDHLGATEYLGELYLELGDIKRARRQLAKLDRLCAFGCAEREDLARLIDTKEAVRSALN